MVHFGDAIPPEYAASDRQILNQYGVPLRTEQGSMSPEELAAEKRLAEEKQAELIAARRDEVLLTTYLSVEEIEALRDRRMELIDGQISVTSNYLQSLRGKLQSLQAEASTFRPYSTDPGAEPMDKKLAQEISNTVESIDLYSKTLLQTRTRQARAVMTFDADISRFKQLKGL